MDLRHIFVFGIISFFFNLVSARVIVVSDIDDTIKVSHVLDMDESFKNGFRTQNVFRGMPELYQQLFLLNPDISFHYVSNAVQTFMQRSHLQFLSEHKFPYGQIWLRESVSESQHKSKVLRTLLSDPSVHIAILIGDNGQRDPEIYSEIAKSHPKVKIMTFIRQIYSSKSKVSRQKGHSLKENQIGFVSPMEIAVLLSEIGLFQDFQIQILGDAYTLLTLSRAQSEDLQGTKGPLSFPRWMDCRDHILLPAFTKKNFPMAAMLINRIRERCMRPGLLD